MASYLQDSDYRIYQNTPFTLPTESINRALMFKQSRYDSNVARIQSTYSNMLNLDISNEENMGKLKNYMDKATKELQSIGKADFSLDDNVATASSVFKPITNDKDLINDIGVTKFFKGELAVADKMRTEDKGVGFNETNLMYVTNEFDRFRTAKGEEKNTVQQRKYSPYVDVMKNKNEQADKAGLIIKTDALAPGGYKITTTNGEQAITSFGDWFKANLSEAEQRQLSIEATVGYENAVKISGSPDKIAQKLAAEYIATSKNNLDMYKTKLKSTDDSIAEIEKLGKAATVQQLQILNEGKQIKKSLEGLISSVSTEIKTSSAWTDSDVIKYAPSIAQSTYIDSKAVMWGNTRAMATYQRAISADEVQLEIMADNTARELARYRNTPNTPNENVDKSKTEWNKLGPDTKPEVSDMKYVNILENHQKANESLVTLSNSAKDEYWDSKAQGGYGTYSTLQKAITKNGKKDLKLSELVNSYNSDQDLTNNLDINSYATALGLSAQEVGQLTVGQVEAKMNIGFNEWVVSSENTPNGDMKAYNYKLKKGMLETEARYWGTISIEVADKAARAFKGTGLVDPTTKQVVSFEKWFEINNGKNGNAKVSTEDIKDYLRTNSSTTAGAAISKAKGALKMKALETQYNNEVRQYYADRDVAAKTLSLNSEYNRYYTINDPKVSGDTAEKTAAQVLNMLNRSDATSVLSGGYNSVEIQTLKALANNYADVVSQVEVSPRPGRDNDYTVKFDADKLAKVLDKESTNQASGGYKNLYFKVLSEGLSFKNIPVEGMTISADYTKGLLDRGKSVDRSISNNFNAKAFRVNTPNGAQYKISGFKMVPERNADDTLVKENGVIKFNKEPIEIAIGDDRNVDEALNNLQRQLYIMNAIYIYSNRADVVSSVDPKSPTTILTYQQLIQAADKAYKLNISQ
jgi:hypothetical protein